MTSTVQDGLFEAVASRAREAGVFASVRVEAERLVCIAKEVESAEYRLDWDEAGTLWVSLVTPDRWLSGSIEGDLVHTGDKMDELVTDELVELGCDDVVDTVEHFRSEDLLFTFRSRTDRATRRPRSLRRICSRTRRASVSSVTCRARTRISRRTRSV